MRLYLVQHGDAVPEAENPDRPLSAKGRKDVGRIAALLARGGVRVARVLHSGKARARETAVLLAQVLGPGGVVEEAAGGLAPTDSTEPLFAAADGWSRETVDVMVVGHQPFMGRMAAHLVAGSPQVPVVGFQPGSVVCLERASPEAPWIIAWMVRPELLGG